MSTTITTETADTTTTGAEAQGAVDYRAATGQEQTVESLTQSYLDMDAMWRKMLLDYKDESKGIIAGLMLAMQDWAAEEDGMMYDSAIQPFIDAARFIQVDFSFSAKRDELKQMVKRVAASRAEKGGE